jgi:hypothetical protein
MQQSMNEKTAVKKSLIGTFQIALIAVWTALLLAAALVSIYPIPGTGILITLASPLSAGLMAPFLGPLAGAISGLIFGFAAPYVNPATSLGGSIFTFLTPTLGALMSGLVLFNRWKEATLIFAVEITVWFANPFAWYQLMPIVTWGYWLAFAFIIIPPLRKWIIDSIVFRDPKRLPIALWCLAWISRVGGDTITGNNIAVWVLNWTGETWYPFWAPWTVYYAIVDSLTCVAGAIVGAAVLLALKRGGTRALAADLFEPIWKSKRSK